MLDVASTYTSGDFELVWPRELFRTELASLINAQNRLTDWDGRVELLLAIATPMVESVGAKAKRDTIT